MESILSRGIPDGNPFAHLTNGRLTALFWHHRGAVSRIKRRSRPETWAFGDRVTQDEILRIVAYVETLGW